MSFSKRLTIDLHGETLTDLEQLLEEALRRYRRGHVVGAAKNETGQFHFEIDEITQAPLQQVTIDEINARVYLAAHAPADIPDWFQPKFPPLPRIQPLWESLEQQPRYRELSKKDKEELDQWMKNHDKELDDHLKLITESAYADHNASHDAYAKAKRDRQKAQHLAWPWYWADQLIITSATALII